MCAESTEPASRRGGRQKKPPHPPFKTCLYRRRRRNCSSCGRSCMPKMIAVHTPRQEAGERRGGRQAKRQRVVGEAVGQQGSPGGVHQILCAQNYLDHTRFGRWISDGSVGWQFYRHPLAGRLARKKARDTQSGIWHARRFDSNGPFIAGLFLTVPSAGVRISNKAASGK